MKFVCVIQRELARYVHAAPTFKSAWEAVEYVRSGALVPLSKAWRANHSSLLKGAKLHAPNDLEIQPYALISGLVVIGKNCRIGPYSFIRGPVVIGDNVKIGPYCEISRAIILSGSIISHNIKVLDSVVGRRVHLSGYVTTCNLPVGRDMVKVWEHGRFIEKRSSRAGRAKYGSIVEDDVALGVLGLLMPGSYVRKGVQLPGPCIVFGDTQARSMVVPKSLMERRQARTDHMAE